MKSIHPAGARCWKALVAVLTLASIITQPLAAFAQGSDFTYQGFLSDAGAPAHGVYDLQFTVYGSLEAGSPVGATTTIEDLAISNGLFTVTVSPGESVFTGAVRWLEIAVRPGESVAGYTAISPRQSILATPYAIMAAAVAGNGAIGSAQLADTVALGATNAPGRLDVYQTVAGTSAITLFGNGPLDTGSQISTYGHDGQEQIRLWGGGYGELLLNNSQPANATAVRLTADGANGGMLALNNTNGSNRAVLSGRNTGGLFQLYDDDGEETVKIRGQGYYHGGEITLSDYDSVGIFLESSIYDGGMLSLYDDDGERTIFLRAANNGGGSASFTANDGRSLVSIVPSDEAGRLEVFGTNLSTKVTLAGLDGSGGSRVTADRLRANVDVGIGRHAFANALEVNGNASKSVAGSWLANSDRRIKTDIQTITNALHTLDGVRLVNFRYTDDYRATHPEIAEHRYLNVIAQEFREIFPGHVQSSGEKLPDGSEILQVDTYPLTIYSAAGVQELHRELIRQQKVIATLESRLTRLEELRGPKR